MATTARMTTAPITSQTADTGSSSLRATELRDEPRNRARRKRLDHRIDLRDAHREHGEHHQDGEQNPRRELLHVAQGLLGMTTMGLPGWATGTVAPSAFVPSTAHGSHDVEPTIFAALSGDCLQSYARCTKRLCVGFRMLNS